MATGLGLQGKTGQVEPRSTLVDTEGSSEAGLGSQGVAPGLAAAASSVQVPQQPQNQEDGAVPRSADSAERLGMRPGERLIVEEMKNLLVGLNEQNQILADGQKALQRRMEQMENDAMQSASSGAEGDRVQGEHELGWVPERVPYLGRFVPPEDRNTLDYRAGIEEGLRLRLARTEVGPRFLRPR